MFANECLGELKYEGTTSAIVMAGAFLAFLLQYISMRVSDARSTLVAGDMRNSQEASSEDESGKSGHLQQASKEHSVIPFRQQDTISVLTLEMGIIFHSIRMYLFSQFFLPLPPPLSFPIRTPTINI